MVKLLVAFEALPGMLVASIMVTFEEKKASPLIEVSSKVDNIVKVVVDIEACS